MGGVECMSKVEGESEGDRRWREGGGLGGDEEKEGKWVGLRDWGSEAQREVELEHEREGGREGERGILVRLYFCSDCPDMMNGLQIPLYS